MASDALRKSARLSGQKQLVSGRSLDVGGSELGPVIFGVLSFDPESACKDAGLMCAGFAFEVQGITPQLSSGMTALETR